MEGDLFIIYRTRTETAPEDISAVNGINRQLRKQLSKRGLGKEFTPLAAVINSVGYSVEWHEPGDTVTNRIGVGVTTDANGVQQAGLRNGLLDTGARSESFPLTGDLLEQKGNEASDKLRSAVVLSEADLAASRQMGPASEIRGEEAIVVWQKIAPTVLATLSPKDPLVEPADDEFRYETRYTRQPDDTDGLPARSIQIARASGLPGDAPLLSITIAFDSSPFTSDSDLSSPGSYFTVAIVQNTGDLGSTTVSYYFAHPTIGGKRVESAGHIEEFVQEPVALAPEVRPRVMAAIARQFGDSDQLTPQRPERYDEQ
jgi:hypothetical protein